MARRLVLHIAHDGAWDEEGCTSEEKGRVCSDEHRGRGLTEIIPRMAHLQTSARVATPDAMTCRMNEAS